MRKLSAYALNKYYENETCQSQAHVQRQTFINTIYVKGLYIKA